jgi:uncharacterized membrane protein YedE/YeeE
MAEPNLIGGFSGGILIGLAAVLLLAVTGRIAGVSGILGGLLTARSGGERSWRLLFVLGLIAGAGLYRLFYGPLPIQIQSNVPVLLAAGVLVGLGTRLGSGCTSGHGVCGLARLSPRSLLATVTFMLFGVFTVYAMKHLF